MRNLCRAAVGAQCSGCQFDELKEMHTASRGGLVRSRRRCQGELSRKPRVISMIGFDLMDARIALHRPPCLGSRCLFKEILLCDLNERWSVAVFRFCWRQEPKQKSSIFRDGHLCTMQRARARSRS